MIISEDDRCYKIRQKAINLLKVHNIDTSTAIDIRELIYSSGRPIKWKILDLKGLSGFTCFNRKKNIYCMFFDENLICNCPARLNFTMAHELGHIILDHFTNCENTVIMDYVKEREANLFVDELLMPTSQIFRHRMNVREIVETYDVSITAAQNKIRYLKSNSLYPQEKALCNTIRIVSKYADILNNDIYDTYNDFMVQKLRDEWLDPDYDSEGV